MVAGRRGTGHGHRYCRRPGRCGCAPRGAWTAPHNEWRAASARSAAFGVDRARCLGHSTHPGSRCAGPVLCQRFRPRAGSLLADGAEPESRLRHALGAVRSHCDRGGSAAAASGPAPGWRGGGPAHRWRGTGSACRLLSRCQLLPRIAAQPLAAGDQHRACPAAADAALAPRPVANRRFAGVCQSDGAGSVLELDIRAGARRHS